jgi:hypothetical protein
MKRVGCLGVLAGSLLVVAIALNMPVSKPTPALLGSTTAAPVTPADDTVSFDPKDAVHKAQMDQMEANAGACMERAMHGLLLQGVRSRQTLLRFAQSDCGTGLKRFLVSLGTSDQAADAYVGKTADDVLAIELQ